MIAQLETGLNLVDKASVATDRWLFLGVLVIMGLSVALAVRWLVSGLREKDIAHEANMKAMRDGHSAERTEWRITMETSKTEFIAALTGQRQDFRAELASERAQFAEERIHDREARHATDNAVNAVAHAISEQNTIMAGQKRT